MSVEGNKAVVCHFVEEAQCRGNLGVLDEISASDYVDHSGLAPSPGLEGTRQFFTALWAALPDLTATIHDQVAEGDKVVTRKTLTGTHKGVFMGAPATGRRISIGVIDIFRLADEKIVEHWAAIDRLELMQQLGLAPAPGQGG